MNNPLTRRHALCCGAAAAAGLFTSLLPTPARAAWRNPCQAGLPDDPLRQATLGKPALEAWLATLWHGLEPAHVWDVHAHLLGNGDSGSGCTLHPSLTQGFNPIERLRHHAILNGACAGGSPLAVDRAYVQRLHTLAEQFPQGARWLLFAFDHACNERGVATPDHTTFHVPNAYAAAVAGAMPQRFAWVASIHPYRPDALARLEQARAQGAVAMKWLPSAMNIDLRCASLRPFYERLARWKMPLIVHCGEEKAVPGAGRDELGNPLHARVPLGLGVRVVMAHCASLGHALDTDAKRPRETTAFSLFARLMDEPAHRDLLLGDISAVFQSNRTPEVWRTILQRQDWHDRLLHGSDYPLPGVLLLQRTAPLVKAGLVTAHEATRVNALRDHNPLLADWALKRCVRVAGAGLRNEVFETRRWFGSATAVA